MRSKQGVRQAILQQKQETNNIKKLNNKNSLLSENISNEKNYTKKPVLNESINYNKAPNFSNQILKNLLTPFCLRIEKENERGWNYNSNLRTFTKNNDDQNLLIKPMIYHSPPLIKINASSIFKNKLPLKQAENNKLILNQKESFRFVLIL